MTYAQEQQELLSPKSTTLHVDITALGITGTPTILLVDHDGTVMDEWIGLLTSREQADVAKHIGIDPNGLTDQATPQQVSLSEQLPDQPSDSTSEGGSSHSPEVLSDELSTIVAQGEKVTILDVRDRQSFNEEHLSGAMNIPSDELFTRAAHEVSKKRPLILYCNYAPWCEANGNRTLCSGAQQSLKEKGFKNVKYIRDRLPLLAQEHFAVDRGLSGFTASR